MKTLFEKDCLLTGIILGLLAAGLTYGLVYLATTAFENLPYWLASRRSHFFIALIPDVLLFRIFMVNRKQDKIGRGILLVVIAVAFLVIFLMR